MSDTTPAMHLQVTGELPVVVLGWRTHDEQYDIPPELIAVYGPVPTQEDAERLIETLTGAFPAGDDNYTVMPAFPVRLAPGGSDSAVVA